ncbi:MAG: T9SS type A sorting domain-containing protein [Bacteroidota bacterium]
MKLKLLLIGFVFCLFQNGFAQKEANMWYFGNNAGVDFNSGSPVAFNGSAMNQLEGCASICDTSGATLFYTNGSMVWNRSNIQMPNGFGLLGDNNSAQAAIIVRAPGSNTTYYIFTTPTWGVGDMCFSIVDMNLQGGFGDVTTKNTPMFTNSTEKVTAVYHANGTDIWVIGHEFNTNNFYSFLLTAGGVNPVPIITSVGTVHQSVLGFAGYMKGSHNGQKLAYACTINMDLVEVLDFDNSTGIPSNPISFNGISEAYGLEFSPDDSKLYATEENPALIIQWDLNAGSAAAIAASQMIIANANSACAALQLGPDKKIYLAKRSASPFLGVINDPDSAGLLSNFVDDFIPLAPGTSCAYGLPNFFQGLFSQSALPVALFNAPNHICPGTCTNFNNISLNATSYLWSFPGANPSTSVDLNPFGICYNSPGQYDVMLIASNTIGSDTLMLPNFITVYPYPAAQGIMQNGDSLIANQGALNYQWYHDGVLIPGATEYFYVASEYGSYNVVATDLNGCEVEAVIFDVVAGIQSGAGSNSGELEIYPNPVTDNIKIKYIYGNANRAMLNSISISNLVGEQVLAVPLSRSIGTNCLPIAIGMPIDLDCRLLPPGMYLVEIEIDNNIHRAKFIKSAIR